MAAYGALVSVMRIMDQIHGHPNPPISLDHQQSESLAANVTFLQEFLEGYNPHVSYAAVADPMESRIAKAAYAAEDVIKSYIVDQLLARSKNLGNARKADQLDNLIAADQILDQPTIDGEEELPEGYLDLGSFSYSSDLALVEEQLQSEFLLDAEDISSIELYDYQECLEGYNLHLSYSSEADLLESRIAEATYVAEDVIESSNLGNAREVDSLDNMIAADQILDHRTNDGEKISCIEFFQCVPTLMSCIAHTLQELLEGYHVIESCIVDQIHARSTDRGGKIRSIEFYQGLQKVIEEMDLIKMEIKEKRMKEKNMGLQIIKRSTTDVGSSRSSSTAQKVTTVVGFDDVLYGMLEKLTRGERVRQIIPIVGMGGLGKTTLARNIYANPLIKEYFDICAWSTISQVHNAQKILSEILDQVVGVIGGNLSEYELGEKLYKYLIGRRYFIVLDDMWSIEAWDVIRMFFPDNENGSRVVVTTRLSNLASQFNYSDGLDMKFLDKASSWELFTKTVFGEDNCPPELEDIGKKIVKGCRGLPLSIVVVGGLLSKSEPTRENWQVIEGNLSSFVNSEGDGSCLQILYMSYNNLPVYMKSCFLYMGVFPEDDVIIVYLLITLWVAEGFIKSFDGKTLEESAAEDCIQELVDRNMILVEERDDCGKMESVKIHDLLRDLALREGEKDKFLCALMQSNDHWEISRGTISSQRRIAASFDGELHESPELQPSLVSSFIGKFQKSFPLPDFRISMTRMINSHSVEESSEGHYEEIFIPLANLRLILVDVVNHPLPKISSWASSFWNLQTLYFTNVGEHYVVHIWKMPLLRHVMIADNYGALRLPDPPLSGDNMDEVVLQNLQSLFVVRDLILSENVLKRIPNINRLMINYDVTSRRGEESGNDLCLNNLGRLHKLQLLRITTSSSFVHIHTLTFPYSLKELILQGTRLHWEEMETKIGCLPLLQVLKLEERSFTGSEWETVEGQFSSLKFLLIQDCYDLEYWITDNTHFPRLEHLVVNQLTKLREIPSSIGDIPTLLSIRVEICSESAVESARRIQEEQEEYGNELLQIQVINSSVR